MERYFWMRQPCGYEKNPFSEYPAFRSFAREMVLPIRKTVGHPEGHGVRPRSLEVATISALKAAVVKRNSNLSLLAFRGNYRAAAAQDIGKYPRNVPSREIFCSGCAQSDFYGNIGIAEVEKGLPIFSDSAEASGGDISNSQFSSATASDGEIEALKLRERERRGEERERERARERG